MPTLTIEYHDESHRIAQALAIAYVTQLRQIVATAPIAPFSRLARSSPSRPRPRRGGGRVRPRTDFWG
jgi:hypothetical protein